MLKDQIIYMEQLAATLRSTRPSRYDNAYNQNEYEGALVHEWDRCVKSINETMLDNCPSFDSNTFLTLCGYR